MFIVNVESMFHVWVCVIYIVDNTLQCLKSVLQVCSECGQVLYASLILFYNVKNQCLETVVGEG
jgi:hypothetical protein